MGVSMIREWRHEWCNYKDRYDAEQVDRAMADEGAMFQPCSDSLFFFIYFTRPDTWLPVSHEINRAFGQQQ